MGDNTGSASSNAFERERAQLSEHRVGLQINPVWAAFREALEERWYEAGRIRGRESANELLIKQGRVMAFEEVLRLDAEIYGRLQREVSRREGEYFGRTAGIGRGGAEEDDSPQPGDHKLRDESDFDRAPGFGTNHSSGNFNARAPRPGRSVYAHKNQHDGD